MVLKLVPRTEQSAAQVAGLQENTATPQILYKPRNFFFPSYEHSSFILGVYSADIVTW